MWEDEVNCGHILSLRTIWGHWMKMLGSQLDAIFENGICGESF